MEEQKFTGERYIPTECDDAEIRIEHTQRYIFASKWVKGKIVLDAACGEGYGSDILSQYAKSVTGLDIDENTIKVAEEKYGSNRLSFKQGSIESLPFESGTFDVIVSFETIEHVESEIQKKFLLEIKRVLKEDGILIMSTPNKRVYTDLVAGINQYHKKEFYYQEYIDFLKNFFSYVFMYNQYPELLYVLTNEDSMNFSIKQKDIEEGRYYISVCSNEKIEQKIYSDYITNSDMYFFLNRYSHILERQLVSDSQKRNEFESMLNAGLEEAKKYNLHLERDIKTLEETLRKKETEIVEITKYVRHLEKDLRELKEEK